MSRAGDLVEIPYSLLQDPEADIGELIFKGFGPDGLGALTVSGVPGFVELRKKLLPLAADFAALPEPVREGYEDPASSYNIGWSHGKEALTGGLPDTLKGSFYANPCQDPYSLDPGLLAKYPTYYRPNIWPRQHMPALEPAFKELGQLVVRVGLLLAQHCNRYLEGQGQQRGPEGDLAVVLEASHCHKARLLHYFPTSETSEEAAAGAAAAAAAAASPFEGPPQDWCGWHLDHGALTGLTSAMYIKEGEEVGCPDPDAGLYIRTRGGGIVRVLIPPNQLAFQVGQVLSIASGGLLRATPHCVKAAAPEKCIGVSRNTFAVFMQPEVTHVLSAPPIPEPLAAVVSQDSGAWRSGMSFGDFAEKTLIGYYSGSFGGGMPSEDEEAAAPPKAAMAAARAAAAVVHAVAGDFEFE